VIIGITMSWTSNDFLYIGTTHFILFNMVKIWETPKTKLGKKYEIITIYVQ